MRESIDRDRILEMVMNHEMEVEDAFQQINQMLENAQDRSESLLLCESVWREKKLTTTKDIINDDILIFTNDDVFAKQLSNAEITTGACIFVTKDKQYQKADTNHYQIRCDCAEDYQRLLSDVENDGRSIRTILSTWAATSNSLQEQLNEGIYSMFLLCKNVLSQIKNREIKFLYLYHDTEQNHAVVSSVASFLKSIRLEQPKFVARCIQLPDKDTFDLKQEEDEIIEIIRQELNSEDSFTEIGYRNHLRSVRIFHLNEETQSSVDATAFQTEGVYLITGGSGKLALLLSRYLGKKYHARIILIGRRELKHFEEKSINELQDQGFQIDYRICNITKKDAVLELMHQVKEVYGTIHGIFHAAGTLKDAFIYQKKKEELDAVFEAKIFGTDVLIDCAKQKNIEFVVLFSSISAMIGNIGQCDYAYANAVMNGYAEVASKESACRVVSINWPLWEDGGMQINEQAREAMKRTYGFVPLMTEDGMVALEKAMQQKSPVITVFYGDLEEIKEKLNIDTVVEKKEVPKKQKNTARTKVRPKEFYKEQTVEYLKKVLTKVTKIQEEDIDEKESFEYYGLDSITAMSIGDELESEFGELSKTLLFEYQNLNELADYFIENYQDVLNRIFSVEDERKDSQDPIETPEDDLGKVEINETKGFVDTYETMAAQLSASQVQEISTVQMEEDEDIAIIGLSGQYPGAENLDEFWENLRNGVDSITLIPRERWHYEDYYAKEKGKFGTTNCKWGGFLKDVDKFDPLFFNISPNEACLMDPQERLFLETAWHAIEDAGYSRRYLNTNHVGVFVGVMYGQYQLLPAMLNGHNLGHTSIYASIANRVSYYFNLSGPSIAMDTMCSSSLTSIHMACNSIRNKECELAIAGGVNVTIHPDKYVFLSQGNFTSEQGCCRSFGEGGDGYVPSEGVGAVLLKPFKKAVEDHDHIYAIIKGSSLNHGGKTSGYTVPNPTAQGVVINDALKRSKMDPQTISYIEAHGTGTSLGDPIEIRGLMNSIGQSTTQKQFCAIGSVKSNIGHAESAAGIAGITKILLQMQYHQLVPSIHSEVINSKINFAQTPFYVEHTLEDWKETSHPRRAGISSFGAGGANAHILFEEFRPEQTKVEKESDVLIVLSAKSKEQLREYAGNLKHSICYQMERGKKFFLTDIAYTLQVGREEMMYRMAVVVDSLEQLLEVFEAYAKGEDTKVFVYEEKISRNNKQALTNAEAQQKVEEAMNHQDLTQLARLWLMGIEIDWMDLYQEKKPYHISLAGYPFKKDRYWIPEGENAMVRLGVLHPLVHRNQSTLCGVKYQTDLNRNLPFYMDETYIQNNEQSILLSILLETAKIATENKVTRITAIENAKEEMEWSKDTTVNIQLAFEDETLLETITGSESGCIYASCVLDTQEAFDLNKQSWEKEYLQNRCKLEEDTTEWAEGMSYKAYQDDRMTLIEIVGELENTPRYHSLPLIFDLIWFMLSEKKDCKIRMDEIRTFQEVEEIHTVVMNRMKNGLVDVYCMNQDSKIVLALLGCTPDEGDFNGALLEILKQVENDELDVSFAESLINDLL